MRKLGVEIENNATTPMVEVVDLQVFAFGRSEDFAYKKMFDIHSEGRAITAIFPEDRLSEIRQRLHLFIDNMNEPIVFTIVDNPSDDKSLDVDFNLLLDWDSYQVSKNSWKHRPVTNFWPIALIILLLVVLFTLWLR